MTQFWLLGALLIAVALAFIVVPLLRRPRVSSIRNDELNIQVIRDQLSELRADLDTGRLEQAAYDAARRDLQRELLDDVDVSDAPAGRTASHRGRWLAAVLVVLVPVLAVLLYQQIGTQQIIPRLAAGAAVSLPTDPAERQQAVEAMVAKLAARMQQEPDNVEGWALLARSYASMGRFTEAAAAYKHALDMDGHDPELLSSYADVLIMVNKGEFTDQVGALLNQALMVNPQFLKALWLRGHWRFRHSEYQGAIDDWQVVIASLPPGDENRATIQKQVNAARSRLGEPPQAVAATAKPPPGAAAGKAVIQVQVSLDPALRAKADANDTVFVFARALHGPRMPLAIVRKRVADLPFNATLDDSLAMSPAMVMSNFDQVSVGARISKTGQAMPASGDLQGLVSPVDTRGGKVSLKIDQVVP